MGSRVKAGSPAVTDGARILNQRAGGGVREETVPVMDEGGNAEVTTANPGAGWAPLPSQPCAQATIANNSGVTLLVRQGGAGVGFPIFDQTYFPFYGLRDLSDLSVKRADSSNEQKAVQVRWEG